MNTETPIHNLFFCINNNINFLFPAYIWNVSAGIYHSRSWNRDGTIIYLPVKYRRACHGLEPWHPYNSQEIISIVRIHSKDGTVFPHRETIGLL